MGNFWRATDRPDLQQVHVALISDPGNTANAPDVLWLENPPAGAVDGLAKIPYGTGVPPLIFTQDMIPGTVYGYDGEQQTFTIEVSGGVLPYAYQWKKRNGTTSVNVGGNAASYSFPSAAGAGGAYYCVVTDAEGTVITSKETVMTYTAQLVFTTQPPADLAQAAGSDLVINAVGAGGVGARKYQWKKDGVNIAGATAATYTKSAATVADSGAYTVTLTDSNPNGAKTITSSPCNVVIS